MWNRKKEQKFIKILKTKRDYLIDNIDFVELQLLEYAATIDFDVNQWGSFDKTELLDFFEWYLKEGLHEILEIETCINIVNFLYFTNFNVDMFEYIY